MMRKCLPVAILLLAACSGQASKQDQLQQAANQSTPEAANVLNGAAENGMNSEDAMNAAAQAQSTNGAAPAPSNAE